MSFQVKDRVQRLEHSTHTTPDVSSDRKSIKVLVPCDGSENSEVALSELRRAGLPRKVDALVAVTHVWLPSSPAEITRAVSARRLRVLTSGVSSFAPALRDHEEYKVLSREAEERIRLDFPTATIRTEALQSEAAVANEIIRKAKQWSAELIIVGAKISSSPDISDYAGPALRITREAECSVRVARISEHSAGAPLRLMVGLEGLESSAETIEYVAERVWPTGSEVHLVLVEKPGPHDLTRDAANSVLEQLAERLRATGLRVFATVTVGQPQEIFLRKARELTVDCVFMHAIGDPAVDGDLSPVAQALVLCAPCSVEVVRKADYSHGFRPAA